MKGRFLYAAVSKSVFRVFGKNNMPSRENEKKGGRSGNDRVCNPCRSFSGNSHCCYHRLSPKDSGIVGRHSKRHQQSVMQHRRCCDSRETGQATVEFAVVTAAFFSLVAVLGVLWRAFNQGLFIQHALSSASHHIESVALGSIADIFLF